jgi:hypothetical protein
MGWEKEKKLKEEAKRAAARTDRKFTPKRNQWDGPCTECRKPVAAQQGFLDRGKVLCEGCGDYLNAGP